MCVCFAQAYAPRIRSLSHTHTERETTMIIINVSVHTCLNTCVCCVVLRAPAHTNTHGTNTRSAHV